MTEGQKTVVFCGTALLLMVVAILTAPRVPRQEEADPRGQLLFPRFDWKDVAQLDIVEFDEKTGQTSPFRIVKQTKEGKTVYVIPSHENYPTDNQDQLADVVVPLSSLKVLDVASTDMRDHAEFGVIDPEERKPGDKGVGTRIVVKDKDNKDLAALVIGKPVADQANQRYVRRVGEDPVYVVDARLDSVTTQFDKWIEKDLLKLSTWDIKKVLIRDHIVDITPQGPRLLLRGETLLEHNDIGDPRWKLLEDHSFDRRGNRVNRPLAEDEELNISRLDDMKNALADLKIIDVSRKPAGLSADLKAGEDIFKNQEAIEELSDHGFHVAQWGDQYEIFSNEGELRVLMKDGVEYILRFGGVVLGAGSPGKKDESKKEQSQEGEEKDKQSKTELNRFLFVTCQFNPEPIEKPKLKPLPEEGQPRSGDNDSSQQTGQQGDAVPSGQKAEDKKPDEQEQQPQDKDNNKQKDSDKDGSDKDKETHKDKDGDKDKQKNKEEELKAERERIQRENQREQERYDEQVKKGKQRVQELNERFADWYYIIPDSTYQKIRLSRADFVKKKEPPKEEKQESAESKPTTPLEEFERLKQEGIEGK